MHVRPFESEDAEQVLEVHRHSVKEVCSQDYGPEEVEAWASDTDEESIAERIRLVEEDEVHTFVAVDSDTVIGFGEYNEDEEEIKGLYVDPDWVGTGAGTALLERIEQEARLKEIDKLECFSTITAKSFYEKHGYTVIEQTQYNLGERELTAYHMRKQLDEE